jgi:hypothetical protein
MHGTSTYTCFIKNNEIKIVSKQVNNDWINDNSVSAVLTTLNKINSDDVGPNITTLNLYIPNADGSKNKTKLNESQRAFIFDKLLPKVMKDYQEIYIFSDTNADYYNLENGHHDSNEFKINKFLDKNKLFQHNNKISNTSIHGSSRVIDHVISRGNNCSVENGGHLGVKEYHPALLTTIKYGQDVKSDLCNDDFCDNQYQDTMQVNIETKIERDWSKLNDMQHLSTLVQYFMIEENSQPYLEFWLQNYMIKYEAQANSFSAKCRLCGWPIFRPTENLYRTKSYFRKHFYKEHHDMYAKESKKDLIWLLATLNFKLE